MRFLADENISPRSVLFLKNIGFDVIHVREVGLRGKSDAAVMNYAREEKRALLTMDSDFADVRNYPLGTHSGIIRMRLGFASSEEVNLCLGSLLKQLSIEDVEGNLIIADGQKYRIRRKK